MATRINYRHRQAISNAAEQAAFVEELAEIETKRAALDRKLAEFIISEYHKAHPKLELDQPMQSFSISLMPKTRDAAPAHTMYVSIELPEPIMGPANDRNFNSRVRLAAENDEIYAQYRAIAERENAIIRVRQMIRSKVYDLTTKVTTLEALAKLWPEGVQFISEVDNVERDKKAEIETLRKDVNELILQSGVELQD